jgi:hypothetical protein
MKYMQSWQDFMRMPENKALKESKGVHACKQKFIQEQNKMQWFDPMIINETNEPGQSVQNSINSDGGSTQFITGHSAHVSTFTWASQTLRAGITGSTQWGITANTLAPSVTDFTSGHTNTRKKVLLAFVTGSSTHTLGALSTAGYDCVVTASAINDSDGAVLNNATGSWANQMAENVANQGATAVVGGFTNTIAPSTLMTIATGSAPSTTFTITNAVAGGVVNASTDIAAGTGSIALTTNGLDTFHHQQGTQIFDGERLPYNNMPRKS